MRFFSIVSITLIFAATPFAQSINVMTRSTTPIRSNLSDIDSITFSQTNVTPATNNRVISLWVSADPEVATKSCLMYAENAKTQKWFDQVVLIVWGPSSKLLSQNTELQTIVKRMIQAGVTVQACIVCADSYGVTQKLRDLGIDVKPMGAVLTDYLKSGSRILTY